MRHSALAVQETIAYRTSYIINVASNFVFYIALFFVWQAIYSENATLGGMGWGAMRSYILVSLFMGALVAGSSEYRISRQIRTGNIALDMLRPYDYQKAILAVTLGNSLTEGLMVCLGGAAFAAAIGVDVFPADALGWLVFAAAIVLAYLTKFTIAFIFGIFSFYTTSIMGVLWLKKGISDFFSGAVIPLSFFPAWLASIADWTPFRGIVALPARAFIGAAADRPALLRDMGIQAAWVAVLWVLGKLFFRAARRKITIQGG